MTTTPAGTMTTATSMTTATTRTPATSTPAAPMSSMTSTPGGAVGGRPGGAPARKSRAGKTQDGTGLAGTFVVLRPETGAAASGPGETRPWETETGETGAGDARPRPRPVLKADRPTPGALSDLHQRLHAAAGERTYRQLADLTRTHPETVRRYMMGQTPSTQFLARFCGELGLSADWLLCAKGPMRFSDQLRYFLRKASVTDLLAALADNLEAQSERLERLENCMHTAQNT